MSKELRLGIIGMSEGNGHPYSWSAICNGYDKVAMASCEFPAIPDYLARETWPAARLADVAVTHIWTQETTLSNKIAAAGRIAHVAANPKDMIGEIDGLLLARDDAENHLSFARPFLEAGLPVYVDKPVALSEAGLAALFDCSTQPGQIFSCSALRYSAELQLTQTDRVEIGVLRKVIATTPKSWRKYAIHLIDPVLNGLNLHDGINYVDAIPLGTDGNLLVARALDDLELVFIATGKGSVNPIEIMYIGDTGSVRKTFRDAFTPFRAALGTFVTQVRSKTDNTPQDMLLPMVRLIEKGMRHE